MAAQNLKSRFILAVAVTVFGFKAFAESQKSLVKTMITSAEPHEVCFVLKVGDIVHWNFKASSPVDFNLHHHIGEKVIMPVKKDGMLSDQGERKADRKNEWCLMWTVAEGQTSSLEGDWFVEKAHKKKSRVKAEIK